MATIRLAPVTLTGGSFWEWRSEFAPPRAEAAALTALVRDGIYRAGFRAMGEYLGLAPAGHVPPP